MRNAILRNHLNCYLSGLYPKNAISTVSYLLFDSHKCCSKLFLLTFFIFVVGNVFLFPRKGVSDYVIVNHGMPNGLSALTACFWMKSADKENKGTPLSYAVRGQHNEFLVYNYKFFSLSVNNEWR